MDTLYKWTHCINEHTTICTPPPTVHTSHITPSAWSSLRSDHVVYVGTPAPQVRSRVLYAPSPRSFTLSVYPVHQVVSRGLYTPPSGQITWVVSGLPIGLVTWSVCPSVRSDHVGGVGAADWSGHVVCMPRPQVRSRGWCRGCRLVWSRGLYDRPSGQITWMVSGLPIGLVTWSVCPSLRSDHVGGVGAADWSGHVVCMPRPQVRSRGWCRGCRLVWSRGLYAPPSGQITWVVSGLPIGLVTWSVCPSLRSDHVGGVGAADWSGHVVCMPVPQVRSRGWCRGCRLVLSRGLYAPPSGQITWVVSGLPIGLVAGNLLSTVLTSTLGYRRLIQLAAPISVISWLTLALSFQFPLLLIARVSDLPL